MTLVTSLWHVRTCKANPGVSTRITQRGLDYAATLGFAELHNQLKHLRKIPDVINTGDTYYSLTNLYLDKFTMPKGHVMLVPAHGLKWTITIANAQITGHWKYSKKVWFFRIGDAGGLKATMPESHVEIIVKLTKTATGALEVKATHCSCDVTFDLETYNWFYNMIIFLFKGTIRKAVESEICEKAVSVINDSGYEQIVEFPLTLPLSRDFVLDYRLEADPIFTTFYIQTDHRARVSWYNSKIDDVPFKPDDLPYISDNKKMLYFIISNYVIDSWTYAAHKHHLLKYDFTTRNLPDGNKDLLMTTCPRSVCIGTIVPQIGKAFPNSEVTIEISTLDRPRSYFHKDLIQLDVSMLLRFSVHLPNISTVDTFGVRINTKADLTATVNNSILYYSVNNMSYEIGDSGGVYLRNHDFTLQVNPLRQVLQIVADNFIVPFLNEIGAEGMPLIIPKKVSFNHTELRIVEDAAIVGTDLTIHSL